MSELFTFTKEEKEYLREVNEDTESLLSPYATHNNQAVRRSGRSNDSFDLRSNFAVDIDRIIHNPLYNRGTDKTQVFSFYHNDDITRRLSHMQLVSRIARIIGKALKLNLDLIEAIAIGHDIGHTPFGHKGEEFLNELYHTNTNRHFNHNVHSARILTRLIPWDFTLQTIDGILCHNGEKASVCYEPNCLASFQELDDLMEQCYTDPATIRNLKPSTLEGCVVRISDMIAYLGKDRQDAIKVKLTTNEYSPNIIGVNNRNIITNIIHNIVKNSRGKAYIGMDKDVLSGIAAMLKENNELIYQSKEIVSAYSDVVMPMMEKLYDYLKKDFSKGEFGTSPLYQHHLNNQIFDQCYRTDAGTRKITASVDDIVVDFIASMTDDYFIKIFAHCFPSDPLNDRVSYIEYFDS